MKQGSGGFARVFFSFLAVVFFVALGVLQLSSNVPVDTSRRADVGPGPAETSAPVVTSEPTPEPTPAPTPEPELPGGRTIFVDGTQLPGGSVVKDGVEFVRLKEFSSALALDPVTTETEIVFPWRKDTVRFSLEGTELSYRGESAPLAQSLLRYREELYLPIESVCTAMEISLFEDEEYNTLDCTPGAGAWPLAEGYPMVLTMYHGVSDNGFNNPEIYVRPSEMREQIEWLLDNGFSIISFEDMWHIEDFEKPVILSYDDGYACMYTDLFPLLQEYQVKATIFVVTADSDKGDTCINWDQVREMQASGLVSIQSHTVSHKHLDRLSKAEQEEQLALSKLYITRETGREPFALAYPYGDANKDTFELTPSYYRFAAHMSGRNYFTGDDPIRIYRLYIPRGMGMYKFSARFNSILSA